MIPQDYFPFKNSEVFFSKKNIKKLGRIKGEVTIVSTVCPDYANSGTTYTFEGMLGNGIGLVASKHLYFSKKFIEELKNMGVEPNHLVLTADLPELVDSQKEFYISAAGSKEGYLEKCQESSEKIQEEGGDRFKSETFSLFYGKRNIDYLKLQIEASERILKLAKEDARFNYSFQSFVRERKALAEKFRGRRLSLEELEIAGAHGMSLYATHGTLLKKIFENKNIIVLNHSTPNLKNFFACELVPGFENLKSQQNFPIGVIPGEFY